MDFRDEDSPEKYLGKTILVGITFKGVDGKVLKVLQFDGVISKIDEDVIEVQRSDDEGPYTLPPDINSLRPAAPGEYTLKTSGKKVINPDYLSTWEVQEPSTG